VNPIPETADTRSLIPYLYPAIGSGAFQDGPNKAGRDLHSLVLKQRFTQFGGVRETSRFSPHYHQFLNVPRCSVAFIAFRKPPGENRHRFQEGFFPPFIVLAFGNAYSVTSFFYGKTMIDFYAGAPSEHKSYCFYFIHVPHDIFGK
tara:strand:- start:12000 stop:12437 length:438 start_codon:yes stop_codon:yes gene_type:complete